MKPPSLRELLDSGDFPSAAEGKGYSEEMKGLELKLLRIQQALWHEKKRAIVVFEGFDAAGKGGAIARLTRNIDPRGVNVWPIGPPTPEEQAKHYLYRFWTRLPAPGTLAIFDRSWYGRVLVERVEGFATRREWTRAYREINEFERGLVDDGVELVKLFLAIDKHEQLRRFEARIRDPYKQWKIGEADLRARARWGDYVRAADDMFELTSKKHSRWEAIPANDKPYARLRVLQIVAGRLGQQRWVKKAEALDQRSLKHELAALRRME